MKSSTMVLVSLSTGFIGFILPFFNIVFATDFLLYTQMIEGIALVCYLCFLGCWWKKTPVKRKKAFFFGLMPLICTAAFWIIAILLQYPTPQSFVYSVPVVRELALGSTQFFRLILLPIDQYIYPLLANNILMYLSGISLSVGAFWCGYHFKK